MANRMREHTSQYQQVAVVCIRHSKQETRRYAEVQYLQYFFFYTILS